MKILGIKKLDYPLRNNAPSDKMFKFTIPLSAAENIEIMFPQDVKEITHFGVFEVNGFLMYAYGDDRLEGTLKKLKLGWKFIDG